VPDEHRTIAEVARGLGVNDETLGNWVREVRIDRGEPEGLTSAEREERTCLRHQRDAGDRGTRAEETVPGLFGSTEVNW